MNPDTKTPDPRPETPDPGASDAWLTPGRCALVLAALPSCTSPASRGVSRPPVLAGGGVRGSGRQLEAVRVDADHVVALALDEAGDGVWVSRVRLRVRASA